jgi:sugar phosphate isomerase/epimerase
MSALQSATEAADLLGAVEVSVDFALDSVTPDILRSLRRLREQGKQLSVHAPFRDLNIASLNDVVYAAARADLLKAMDVAIEIGAGVLTVHPGIHAYFPQTRYAEMKARERDVFETLCARGEQHHVLVAVENLIDANAHFEDSWTMDAQVALVQEVNSPVLGFCLDTGHAFQAGLDLPAAVRRLASVKAGAGRGGGLALIHTHIHDNHGGPIDEHLPVGDGSINWPPVVRALQAVDYSGLLVFETRGIGPQRLALSRWRQLTGLVVQAGVRS